MCRSTHTDNPDGDWCTELRRDQSTWDTRCPLRPSPEFKLQEKVSEFIETIQSFCKGEATIEDVINKAQHDELRQWYVQHGQMAGRHRAKIIKLTAVPVTQSMQVVVDKNCRLKDTNNDNILKQGILDRDHYYCRYCGNKLIDKKVLENLARIAKRDQLKLFGQKLIQVKENGRTKAGNEDVPGLFFFTCPVIDHVKPCSHGGRKDASNLVSSCYACNYGKQELTCEQIGINNPFERPLIETDWDGLKCLIDKLELRT